MGYSLTEVLSACLSWPGTITSRALAKATRPVFTTHYAQHRTWSHLWGPGQRKEPRSFSHTRLGLTLSIRWLVARCELLKSWRPGKKALCLEAEEREPVFLSCSHLDWPRKGTSWSKYHKLSPFLPNFHSFSRMGVFSLVVCL